MFKPHPCTLSPIPKALSLRLHIFTIGTPYGLPSSNINVSLSGRENSFSHAFRGVLYLQPRYFSARTVEHLPAHFLSGLYLALGRDREHLPGMQEAVYEGDAQVAQKVLISAEP
jgi:hypothetical protein